MAQKYGKLTILTFVAHLNRLKEIKITKIVSTVIGILLLYFP